MSTIKIDDLHPTGAELFSDSESYMNELGDNDLDDINGGRLISLLIRATRAGSRAARSAIYRHSPRINRAINETLQPGGPLSLY